MRAVVREALILVIILGSVLGGPLVEAESLTVCGGVAFFADTRSSTRLAFDPDGGRGVASIDWPYSMGTAHCSGAETPAIRGVALDPTRNKSVYWTWTPGSALQVVDLGVAGLDLVGPPVEEPLLVYLPDHGGEVSEILLGILRSDGSVTRIDSAGRCFDSARRSLAGGQLNLTDGPFRVDVAKERFECSDDMVDTNFKLYKRVTDDADFSRYFLDWLFERFGRGSRKIRAADLPSATR